MKLYDLLLSKSLSGGGGGGGGLFVATYTNNNDTWECDKTLDEIIAAIEAGMSVWAYNSADDSYMRLCSFDPISGDGRFVIFDAFGMNLEDTNVYLFHADITHFDGRINCRYDEALVPQSGT